jgi:hypothetical protein
MAAARYPDNFTLRQDYIRALEECARSPAYHVLLPGGDRFPCHCEPFMPDDTKGWTVIKRKIHVKKIKTDAQLNYEAAQMHEYWETASADSWTVSAPTGEHNGALFDIGSRF